MMQTPSDANDMSSSSSEHESDRASAVSTDDDAEENEDAVTIEMAGPELCATCAAFIADIRNLEFNGSWTPSSPLVGGVLVYGPRLYLNHSKDILRSAKEGCKVCALFCEHLKDDSPNRGVSIEVFASQRKDAFAQAMFRLEIDGEREDYQLYQPVGAGITTLWQLPLSVASRCDDPRAISLARVWMEDCHANHNECRTFRSSDAPLSDTPLPTRVLHVPPGLSDPKLMVSNGRRGKYATLSHCWGKSERITLTDNTLDDFQKGIPLDSLPATFKDAISVIKALGIEYIWIDCFGIMQDSKSDWLEESKKMADIYSNSAISLCAVRARDSHEGLFLDRRFTGVEVEVPHCGFSGVRRLVNDMQDELFMAPADRRAWILQETTLAPAVLYFGTNSLYWRCFKRCASESFPVATPLREPLSHLSSGLPTHLFFESDPHTDPFLVWYSFVREYTWRDMTYSTDRLIAIQGLAQRVSYSSNSHYEYGLLISDLYRGLLWHRGFARGENFVYSRTDFEYEIDALGFTTHFEDYYAPSWSWGSLIGGVQYDWGELDMPFLNKVEFEYQVQPLVFSYHPAEQLYLKGYLVEGYCRLKRYYDGLVVVFRSADTNVDTAPQLSCIIDLDQDFNTMGCYLLPISAWSAMFLKGKNKTASTVAFYLILVKDEATSTSAESHYRRIGMGGDYIRKVTEIMQGSEKKRLVLV